LKKRPNNYLHIKKLFSSPYSFRKSLEIEKKFQNTGYRASKGESGESWELLGETTED